MKKLLALCAAAALALGIAGCANEDATLSVDDALASTAKTAELVSVASGLTVKVNGKEVNEIELEVGGNPAAITVSSTSASFDKDKVSYASSDESIAKVSAGSVTAVAEGTAEISIAYDDEDIYKIEVTVTAPSVTYTYTKKAEISVVGLEYNDIKSTLVSTVENLSDTATDSSPVTQDCTFTNATPVELSIGMGKLTLYASTGFRYRVGSNAKILSLNSNGVSMSTSAYELPAVGETIANFTDLAKHIRVISTKFADANVTGQVKVEAYVKATGAVSGFKMGLADNTGKVLAVSEYSTAGDSTITWTGNIGDATEVHVVSSRPAKSGGLDFYKFVIYQGEEDTE